MSAAPVLPVALVLPYIWACESPSEPEISQTSRVPRPGSARAGSTGFPRRIPAPKLDPGTAFYRRYTEALLRRYVRMSLEVGRTPSLLGREMFRAKVTSYRVQSFEDVVIFVHDIERCIGRLSPEHQQIVARIALQEYNAVETAAMLNMTPKTVLRRYGWALDHLTRILLDAGMLRAMNSCQGGQTVENSPSC